MKRRYFIIPFLLLFVLIVASTAYFEYRDGKKPENKTLKVAGDNHFPPYEFLDEKGSYTGFNVDIITAIALSEGFTVEFLPMPWHEATEKLTAGEIDVIQGMKITPERERSFDFSRAYLENSQSIFVRSETEGIEGLEDLAGMRIAIQRGDSITSRLLQISGLQIYSTENQEQALKKLAEGDVDAFVGNTLTASFFIRKGDLGDKVKIAGKVINPTLYAAAVKKGDKTSLIWINRGIKRLKLNGTYDKIYRKWFGQPINPSPGYIRKLIYIAGILLIMLLLSVALFYKWNQSLKKEVAKKTYELNRANCILNQKNERIREELELRGVVLNKIFNGVFVLNEAGIITFMNDLAYQVIGQAEGLVGKSYRATPLYDIIGEGAPYDKTVEKAVFLGERKLFIEYSLTRIHVLGDEEIEQDMVVLRDRTEEKMLQETIRTKDKVECLGSIMAGIAHEIRNPLTAIKTYVGLIPAKHENEEFMEACTRDLATEVDRINCLISDLIEYTKPRISHREKLNLDEQLRGTLILLTNPIKKKNIRVIPDIDKSIFISFDKNHFRQVVLNVLMNAIDALDKADKTIGITAQAEVDKVCLVFEDNGCGIEERAIGKLFEPFFTTKATGTGLGLFVTYNLMAENGGEIEISSEPGQGTKVSLDLNKWEEAPDEQAADY